MIKVLWLFYGFSTVLMIFSDFDQNFRERNNVVTIFLDTENSVKVIETHQN